MARTTWGWAIAAMIAGGVWCWTASAQQAYTGVATAPAMGPSHLITHFLPVEGKPTALTIIDPQLRSIGVYHINRETGEIHLKSVRNFGEDLKVDYFNSNSPLPEEIRAGLGRLP